MAEIEVVPKEEVKNYHFVTEDVLPAGPARKERMAMLEKAMVYGNGYHGKVRIVFDTVEGTKAVVTTVWQAAEDSVSLKGGINIPIHSIREVNYE